MTRRAVALMVAALACSACVAGSLALSHSPYSALTGIGGIVCALCVLGAAMPYEKRLPWVDEGAWCPLPLVQQGSSGE